MEWPVAPQPSDLYGPVELGHASKGDPLGSLVLETEGITKKGGMFEKCDFLRLFFSWTYDSMIYCDD